MAQVFCVAVLLMGSLINLVAHHVLVERERQSGPAWVRTQAQALGHGGLMWALARLEDPRALDDSCRATTPGPGRMRFSERAERPGARMSCTVGDAPQAVSSHLLWTCRCEPTTEGVAANSDASPGNQLAPSLSGRVVWFFEPAGEFLLLVVTSQWRFGALEASSREQVLLRRDTQSVWRMVVGSWWDDRS